MKFSRGKKKKKKNVVTSQKVCIGFFHLQPEISIKTTLFYAPVSIK